MRVLQSLIPFKVIYPFLLVKPHEDVCHRQALLDRVFYIIKNQSVQCNETVEVERTVIAFLSFHLACIHQIAWSKEDVKKEIFFCKTETNNDFYDAIMEFAICDKSFPLESSKASNLKIRSWICGFHQRKGESLRKVRKLAFPRCFVVVGSGCQRKVLPTFEV